METTTEEGKPRVSTRGGVSPEKAAVLLEEAREINQAYVDLMDENFREGAEDLRFIHGDQWDERAKKDRENAGRPCMTFPKLTQFIDQLVGEEHQQRPSIKVMPADGVERHVMTATKRKISMAQAYAGLVRNIERTSHANVAYDNGFESAISVGWGHWRVLKRYVHDSFDQELVIAPIWDHFAVRWDPAATEYTREDAKHCFIRGRVPLKEFERRYPGAVTSSAENATSTPHAADWFDHGDVIVSEWFRKVDEKYRLALLSDGRVVRADEIEKVKDEMAKSGATVVKERDHLGHRIEWYLISAQDVLEGPIPWSGAYIPVIPCWGRHLYYEGKMRYRGLIRHSKDEARSYNYSRTALIEKVALAPRVPWVIADEQVEPFRGIWATANTENHAFLPYKAVRNHNGTPLPPPQRDFGSTDISGIAEMIQLSEAGMKSSIGIYDPSLGRQSNEKSGKAIIARQEQGDRGTAAFLTNLKQSIAYTGRILVDLIPKTFDGTRTERIVNDDETEDSIVLNEVIIDEQSGEEVTVNDVTVGRFDVAVDVGPSFLTRRMEAMQAMTDFIQAVPAAGPLIADLVAANSDWPGADAVAKRLQKGLVPPQVQDSGEGADMPPEAQAAVQEAQTQAQAAMEQAAALQQQAEQLAEQLQQAELKAQKLEMDNRKMAIEKEIADAQGELVNATRELKGQQQQAKAGSDVDRVLAETAQQNEQLAEIIAMNTEALAKLAAAVAALGGQPQGQSPATKAA